MGDTSESAREIPVQEGMTRLAIRGMAEFVKAHYLDPNLDSFSDRSYRENWSKDGGRVELDWELAPPETRGRVNDPSHGMVGHLSIGPRSISIRFSGLDAADEQAVSACRRAADDLEMLATSFLTRAKKTTLYFIFSTGERGAAKDTAAPGRSLASETLRRVISGNMMNLYLLIMVASFGLFFLLGDSAIPVVIVLQLVALFYSDKIALLVGRVRPTPERPRVTMVCVPISPETGDLIAKFGKNLTSEISDRLEARLSRDAAEGPDAAKVVQEVLASSGIKPSTEEVKIVTRDVYGLVKGVADRFRLPVPKITIMNGVADNAAATGVSPGRSSITITAGSLEDLGDAELSSVIGHELGHIRGRDSLILFSATFFLYFGGLYLWFPVVVYFGILYYFIIFAIIFSIGKVLETRADTESVAKLGDPKVLASALTSIGFRQLYYERYSPGVRFLDWLRFDPHPPIYFRVQRLSRLATGGREIGNTLLISIKDCAYGFLEALT
jgi:heat shock protein HtpX